MLELILIIFKKFQPLVLASINNYPDLVKLLLDKGADINLKGYVGSLGADTALIASIREDGLRVSLREDKDSVQKRYLKERENRIKIAKMLDRGANRNIRGRYDHTFEDIIKKGI